MTRWRVGIRGHRRQAVHACRRRRQPERCARLGP
jgi:hypothetical protein